MDLRFHWMLPKGGEVAVKTAKAIVRYRALSWRGMSPAVRPDMEGWVYFARNAEAAGIDSVLIPFSRYEPDPLIVSCGLGLATQSLKFIAAFRAGLSQPATFVQQVNTVSAMVGGRVALNVVAGSSSSEQRGYGDFLPHDERYARAEEFMAICHSFWRGGDVDFEGKYYRIQGGKLHTPFLAPDRKAPEIYVSGHSEQSERLARTAGTCWLRVADTPEKLAPAVARIRSQGLQVCLRMGLTCRPTREEAVDAARAMLPDDDSARQKETLALKDDSQMYREAAAAGGSESWLSPSLWTGLVSHYGPVWTALVGTPREVADAFLEYKRIGVTEFILSGCPEVDTVKVFGSEVLPLVREAERRERL
jgi:alkanesulfonate monooxygenase